MRIIAVINQKGGTGKTTTAINLAAGLARHLAERPAGSPVAAAVLLMDLDPQGHATSGLGLEVASDQETMYHVMTQPRKALADSIVSTAWTGLDVAPSHIRLAVGAEQIYARPFRETILAKALQTLAERRYAYIIMDCPPTLGVLTVNALCACDWIIVPCQMSPYSLDGLADLFDSVETVKGIRPELNHGDTSEGNSRGLRLLLTMYDKRNSVTNEAILAKLAPYQSLLLRTVIRRNEALNQAQMARQPIQEFDPKSPGAHDYQDLTAELLALWGNHHPEETVALSDGSKRATTA